MLAHKSGFTLIIQTTPFWNLDRMNKDPRMSVLDILDETLDTFRVSCIA